MKKLLQILIPLGIGLGIFVYYISGFSTKQIEEIKSAFFDVNYFWVILSLMIGFISHLIRAYRWKYLLEPISNHPPRIHNLILSVGISYLVNLGIPRSGEVARAALLSKYENIIFPRVLGTIFTERIVDMFMLGLFIVWGLFLEFSIIKQILISVLPGDGFLFTRNLILIVILLLSLLIVLYFSKSSLSLKIKKFLTGIISGLLSIFKIKHIKSFIIQTLLIWASYLLMLYVVMLAFEDISKLDLGAIILVFIVGSLSIVISNGGIGTYPVFVTEALMLYGISKETGFAFSLLMWTTQTLLVILFGMVSFILLPVLNRKYPVRQSNL